MLKKERISIREKQAITIWDWGPKISNFWYMETTLNSWDDVQLVFNISYGFDGPSFIKTM